MQTSAIPPTKAAIVPVRMRRWNGRRLPDGLRLLICRYRPRGVRKSDETWDEQKRIEELAGARR
jgi:uncharacterized protein YeaO (DUF488 family)